MLGTMQDWPLLVHTILDHAARFHGGRKVVARRPTGGIVRTTYAALHTEARRVTARLLAEGIRPGDRVAALCWNTDRHLALWYGVMGAGAVHHTVNPRLFRADIAAIIEDAADRLLFADVTFLPLLEAILPELSTVERVVLLADRADVPETSVPALAFDEWLGDTQPGEWVAVDERAASGMCYTSGTTGVPKGVLYSHRSNVLHALAASAPDVVGASARDVVLMCVPMFHANSWSLAFSAPMQGSALVLPGADLDPVSLTELINAEGVTISAGVPTVWLALLDHLERTGATLPSLKRVLIGGSACPRAITAAFERRGIEVRHAWGMTEMSPLGTIATPTADHSDLDETRLLDLKERQGRPFYTVDLKITDDEDRELPWDGRTFGRLKVRGAAVTGSYVKGRGAELFSGGWFDTGDVAHIDAHGFMRITDRAKDVIKSGGEWISSIDLENHALAHPDVAEAAVVGVPHPKWSERPLLVVVPREGTRPDPAAILAVIAPKVAKWWLPDRVVFVAAIPHTATGKIQKTALRERFAAIYTEAAQ
jgi:fatty-acyl-CoA synthase